MKPITLALSLVISCALSAQTLDNTFNGTGIVKTDFSYYPQAMAVQPDGKVVVASQDWEHSVFLLRYNEDGSLDHSFGSGGVATHTVAGDWQINGELSLALQPDGKALVGGSYYVENTNMSRLFVLRFTQDGNTDPSFGDGGIAINDTVTFDFSSGCTAPSGEEYASYNGGSIALDNSGRIVQAGTRSSICDFTYPEQFYAKRYLPDGMVDQNFAGVSGGLTYTYANSELAGTCLVRDSFTFLVGYGLGYGNDSLRRVPKIMVLGPNGDPGFGIAYSLKVADPAVEYYKAAAFVALDSSYLVAGTIRTGGRDKFAVTKVRRTLSTYLPYFDVDSSFGANGTAIIDLSPTYCELHAALGLAGGKILLGGSAQTNPIVGSDMVMVHLNEDGTLDQGFANGGILRKDHDTGADYLFSLKPSSDGKMVAMGATEKNFEGYVVLMRYSDGLTSIVPTEGEILAEAFPNPTCGEVRFRFAKAFSGNMILIDTQGREISRREIVASTDYCLSMDGYPSGKYAVRFDNAEGSLICKVVKQ